MNRPWARSSTPLDFLLPLAAPRFPVRPFLEPGVNLFATFSKAIITAIVYDVFIVAVTVLVFYFFCALFFISSLPSFPSTIPSFTPPLQTPASGRHHVPRGGGARDPARPDCVRRSAESFSPATFSFWDHPHVLAPL